MGNSSNNSKGTIFSSQKGERYMIDIVRLIAIYISSKIQPGCANHLHFALQLLMRFQVGSPYLILFTSMDSS